jgi:hypothetical protein
VAETSAHRAFIEQATPVVTTTHFRFFGDEAVHGTLQRLAEDAESRLSWMCNQLGNCDRIKPPIDVWIADDAEAFAAAFPGPSPMSEWAAGVAFLNEQRIVLRAHGTAVFNVRETFEHELAHVLTHVFASEHAQRWPRWFSEGLAIWLSGESILERMDRAYRAAAGGGLLEPTILTSNFPLKGAQVELAYAQSALTMRWIAQKLGPKGVIALLHDVGSGQSFDAAFTARVGVTPEDAIAAANAKVEDNVSFFYHFWDGNLIWGFVTILFVVVAWWRLKERRAQLRALDDAESARILDEDQRVLEAWQRAATTLPVEPVSTHPPRDLLN